jgi:hypothetical protein
MILPRPAPEDFIRSRAREVIADAKLVVEHARRGCRGLLLAELKTLAEIGRQAELVAADADKNSKF